MFKNMYECNEIKYCLNQHLRHKIVDTFKSDLPKKVDSKCIYTCAIRSHFFTAIFIMHSSEFSIKKNCLYMSFWAHKGKDKLVIQAI